MESDCLNCGKLFLINNFVRGRKHFCSQTCQKLFWVKRNREKALRQKREYNARRKNDPIRHAKDLECRRKWRQENKDKKYSYKRSYRARKYGNGGSHTKWEWEALKLAYEYTCQMCNKKEPEIKLTEDHINSLTKGGTDYIENIQPLCRVCNSLKSNRE